MSNESRRHNRASFGTNVMSKWHDILQTLHSFWKGRGAPLNLCQPEFSTEFLMVGNKVMVGFCFNGGSRLGFCCCYSCLQWTEKEKCLSTGIFGRALRVSAM